MVYSSNSRRKCSCNKRRWLIYIRHTLRTRDRSRETARNRDMERGEKIEQKSKLKYIKGTTAVWTSTKKMMRSINDQKRKTCPTPRWNTTRRRINRQANCIGRVVRLTTDHIPPIRLICQALPSTQRITWVGSEGVLVSNRGSLRQFLFWPFNQMWQNTEPQSQLWIYRGLKPIWE